MTTKFMSSTDVSRLGIEFPRPNFDVTALLQLADRQLTGVRLVVRKQLLKAIQRPWALSEAALADVFFRNPLTTSFESKPHQWTRFHEPQITGGLAHFLNCAHSVTRLERSQAFLKAIWSGDREDDVERMTTATATAEEGRIDLTVIASDSQGHLMGAVVEAKFGHKVTARQLPKYKRIAICKGLAEPHQRRLVVIAPENNKALRAFLRRNAEWRFLSWWRFLLSFDRHLQSSFDDAEFRCFRRSIWYRAYGL